jgi:hypothetical protein
MRPFGFALSLGLSLLPPVLLAGQPTPRRPVIQVALLLDTSNSMDGLIDQAKSQLWNFVNQFAPLRRDGLQPELLVALYEYGKSSIPAPEGHLRQILPFTTDLDRVSQELFALRTYGGEEYCGRVIQASLQGLAWSGSDRDLKVIFIAGNEPFTQGTVDYRQSCAAALANGITVNTLFCGSHQEGLASNWGDGARLGGGAYMHIDQNRKAIHIPAPQDGELEQLGIALNTTYIPLGELGARNQANQAAQDSNAKSAAPAALSERAKAKASGFYRNESWDLVDGVKAGTRSVESLDKKDLPGELRGMKPDELKAHVAAKAKVRVELQVKIQKLSEARDRYLATKRQEAAAQGVEKTLDAAMVEALSAQALAKGYVQGRR